MEEQHFLGRMIADALCPDAKGSLRCFDRDQLHATAEQVIATRVVEIRCGTAVIVLHISLLCTPRASKWSACARRLTVRHALCQENIGLAKAIRVRYHPDDHKATFLV